MAHLVGQPNHDEKEHMRWPGKGGSSSSTAGMGPGRGKKRKQAEEGDDLESRILTG